MAQRGHLASALGSRGRMQKLTAPKFQRAPSRNGQAYSITSSAMASTPHDAGASLVAPGRDVCRSSKRGI